MAYSVVKLTSDHITAVKPLFDQPYRIINQNKGDDDDSKINKVAKSFSNDPGQFNHLLYSIFCGNYLAGLKNFHAFGHISEGEVKALISFYESPDEPSWYYTVYRSSGNNDLLRDVLDAVISYNERNGRLKFYTLTSLRHSKLLRNFHWSKYNSERYGYFDEYICPARHRTYYTTHWELLYKRFLLPTDSIVRCNFLKQEYRTTLPVGGNI